MIIVVLIIKCITFIKLYSILALHGHAKKNNFSKLQEAHQWVQTHKQLLKPIETVTT